MKTPAILVYSPSRTKYFYCDQTGADAIEALYRKKRGVNTLSRDPLHGGIRFDFGGSVMVGEPETSTVAASILWSFRARDYEALVHILSEAPEYEDSGCIAISLWPGDRHCVISTATRKELVTELARIRRRVLRYAGLANQEFANAAKGLPIATSVRPPMLPELPL